MKEGVVAHVERMRHEQLRSCHEQLAAVVKLETALQAWIGGGRISGAISEQLPRRNVKRFPGGLVSKADRRVYHSTLGSRVIKIREREQRRAPCVRVVGPFSVKALTTRGPTWGHSRFVLGAIGSFLEPFCGHLSPKLTRSMKK